MLKKLLFPLFSAFLAFRSIELVRGLLAQSPDRFSWVDMAFTAVIFNLFVTGVLAFIGFAYPSHRLLPTSYYTIRSPKWLSKAYTFLKVEIFRKAIMIVFWGSEKNRKKYFDGTRSGINNLIYQSKQSEFGHLGALVLILGVAILLLTKGYFLLFILTTIINLIGNGYPILLQRHHRMRIQRIAKRFSDQ